MFLYLRTIIYAAPDLAATKAWYAETFGIQPYFDERFYVGFSINGFELGLDPNQKPSGATGPVVYWKVADIQTAHAHLLSKGAAQLTGIQEVGGGIQVATVIDPFGNQVGIIQEN